MSILSDLLDLLLKMVIAYVTDHPVQALIFAWVIVRMFGTTVQSGWKGVLFRFGRVARELEPGFHPMIPFVHRIRKTPIRSISLHLPIQRVTTADGLVYDVQANLVYRIVDPKKALVQIDDIRKGCEAVLPIIVQDLLRDQTRARLQERKALEEEFAVRAEACLQRWGVMIEQAGFMSIAPAGLTLRLTQLELLTRERERMLGVYVANGLAPELAAVLLGTDRKVREHAAARYRARSRQVAVYVKAFLAEERRRLLQELIKAGISQAEATAHLSSDRSWMTLAAVPHPHGEPNVGAAAALAASLGRSKSGRP